MRDVARVCMLSGLLTLILCAPTVRGTVTEQAFADSTAQPQTSYQSPNNPEKEDEKVRFAFIKPVPNASTHSLQALRLLMKTRPYQNKPYTPWVCALGGTLDYDPWVSLLWQQKSLAWRAGIRALFKEKLLTTIVFGQGKDHVASGHFVRFGLSLLHSLHNRSRIYVGLHHASSWFNLTSKRDPTLQRAHWWEALVGSESPVLHTDCVYAGFLLGLRGWAHLRQPTRHVETIPGYGNATVERLPVFHLYVAYDFSMRLRQFVF